MNTRRGGRAFNNKNYFKNSVMLRWPYFIILYVFFTLRVSICLSVHLLISPSVPQSVCPFVWGGSIVPRASGLRWRVVCQMCYGIKETCRKCYELTRCFIIRVTDVWHLHQDSENVSQRRSMGVGTEDNEELIHLWTMDLPDDRHLGVVIERMRSR